MVLLLLLLLNILSELIGCLVFVVEVNEEEKKPKERDRVIYLTRTLWEMKWDDVDSDTYLEYLNMT